MKRAVVSGLAVLLGSMATVALAFESGLDGYARMRVIDTIDQDGSDSGSSIWADGRFWLNYLVVFRENFKFVNALEVDAVSKGPKESDGYAESDYVDVTLKNCYVDFQAGIMHVQAGVQNLTLAHSWLIDANGYDLASAVITFDTSWGSIPIYYIKPGDDDAWDIDADTDIFAVAPLYRLSTAMTVQPYLFYKSDTEYETDMFWAGADLDGELSQGRYWVTGIYNFGETDGADVSAYLVGFGSSYGAMHSQIFYGSGDTDLTDNEISGFQGTGVSGHRNSEIVGTGLIDYPSVQAVNNETGGNFFTVGIGTTITGVSGVTLAADFWYHQLAEKNAAGEREIGTEVNLKAIYPLTDFVNLTFSGAYLRAGSAYGQEDPVELTVQLEAIF